MSAYLRFAAVLLLALIAIAPANAAEKRFLLATTTSTDRKSVV